MESKTSPAPSGSSAPQASSARGFQTFGHYSQLFRAALADEESLQLGEGLQTIATQIELVANVLRAPPADPAVVARSVLALLDLLRDYRHLMEGMGEDWQGSYEFKAHWQALTQFRDLLTRWVNEAGLLGNPSPDGAEFELSAWRLLGAGALLLDAFEQPVPRDIATDMEAEKVPEEPSWWGRILTVLHLKP